MASEYRLEYTAPNGTDSVVFDPRAIDGPYLLLRSPEGLVSSNGSGKSVRAPGQRGETLAGIMVSPKVLAISVGLLADTHQEYWELREELARVLVIEPPLPGEDPEQGTLTLYRPGLPTLELICIPEDSPREGSRVAKYDQVMDVEFRAFTPYWRSQTEDEQDFQEAGGFTFPLEHPFEITAFNVRATPTNGGNVSAPIVATINGEAVNPRLVNDTTGKTMEFTISLADDASIVIDTTFGQKSITHKKADGTTENGMKYLDLTTSELWWLKPGENVVLFEADDNVSGSAHIAWRSQRSGV